MPAQTAREDDGGGRVTLSRGGAVCWVQGVVEMLSEVTVSDEELKRVSECARHEAEFFQVYI